MKPLPAALFFLIILLPGAGCEEESVSLSDWLNRHPFQTLTDESALYTDLNLTLPIDYLEVFRITSDIFDLQETIFTSGTLCQSTSLPEACQSTYTQLTGMVDGEGFNETCLSFCETNALLLQSGDSLLLVNQTEVLHQLLGDLDTPGDVLLYVRSQGYEFDYGSPRGASIFMEENTTYVMALNTVSLCAPLQQNAYLLEVLPNGAINILLEEVYYSEADLCL